MRNRSRGLNGIERKTGKALRAAFFFILSAVIWRGFVPLSFAAFTGDDKGTSAGQFLKLGAGARAAAMGEAYSAICEDADAVYWNPGALGGIRRISGIFMHADLFTELNYEYLGYAQPLKNSGGLGLGVQYLSAGRIPETDSSGFETGTDMNPSQLAVALAYGRKMDVFGIGASAKYIRSRLAGAASAFAVDLGALSPGFMADQMRLAFVIQNIGGGLKYDQKSDPLPLNIKIGSLLKFAKDLTLGVDINSPRDNKPYAAAGGEYVVHYGNFSVAGRLGYNSRTSGDLGGLSGISAGLGARSRKLALDYAFVPFGSLGSAHRISIAFRFENMPPANAGTADAYGGYPDLLINDPGAGKFMPEIKGVKISGDAYQSYLAQARIYAELRNYAGAAAKCRAASALLSANDARRIYLLERQGWLALNGNDLPGAKLLYIEAIQAAKKQKGAEKTAVNAYCGLAYCMEKAGDIFAAELNYNHALELTTDAKLTREIEKALKRLRALDKK